MCQARALCTTSPGNGDYNLPSGTSKILTKETSAQPSMINLANAQPKETTRNSAAAVQSEL
jgi:hypothetical protein